MCKAALLSLVASIASVLGVASGHADENKVQNLVDRHETGRSLVATVELTMDLSMQPASIPGPFGKAAKYRRCAWAKNRLCERIESQGIRHPGKGNTLFDVFADYFLDGKTLRTLRKFNPEDPPRIRETCREDIGCTIEAQTRNIPEDPAVFLLFRISLPLGVDGSWTLRELVQASPMVSLLPAEQIEGHRCPGLRIEHPVIEGSSVANGTFAEVFVDPDANYAIRQVREHIFYKSTTSKPAANLQEPPNVRTVKRFRDFGQGVYFPEEAELVLANGIVRAVVTRLEVNQPLSSKALAFQFPKFAQVVYDPPINGKYKVVVWGDNNRPLREIFGPADLQKIYDEFHVDPETRYEIKPFR